MDSLLDELCVEISSRIAAFSLSDVRNLSLVSKSFQHVCNDKYVLSRVSLHEIPLFPWPHNSERFSNLFKRCRRSGNPEALYRKGFINYFLDNRKHKGFQLLAEVAEKGNKEAKYVYGMILICSEGKPKQKGFKILSSLMKPLMSNTIKELGELRYKIRDNLWWRGKPVMKQLKKKHVLEKCECDGQTKMFFLKNCAWHGYGEDNDIKTSLTCKVCLWHNEVEFLFDNIE